MILFSLCLEDSTGSTDLVFLFFDRLLAFAFIGLVHWLGSPTAIEEELNDFSNMKHTKALQMITLKC